YWNRPSESEAVFRARIADGGDGGWLRTGDLGFLRDGELVVTGRLKDLIIIRGRNHHPHDLELTAEAAHASLRPGCAAAFVVDHDGEELLTVVHEVARGAEGVEVREVARAVRLRVAERHEVRVGQVVLIPAGALPKTSSGKIRRGACRDLLVAGDLPVLGRDVAVASEVAVADPATVRALPPSEQEAALEAYLRGLLADSCG